MISDDQININLFSGGNFVNKAYNHTTIYTFRERLLDSLTCYLYNTLIEFTVEIPQENGFRTIHLLPLLV